MGKILCSRNAVGIVKGLLQKIEGNSVGIYKYGNSICKSIWIISEKIANEIANELWTT